MMTVEMVLMNHQNIVNLRAELALVISSLVIMETAFRVFIFAVISMRKASIIYLNNCRNVFRWRQ